MPEFESLVSTWLNVTFPVSFQLDELIGLDEEESKKIILEKINGAYDAKKKT